LILGILTCNFINYNKTNGVKSKMTESITNSSMKQLEHVSKTLNQCSPEQIEKVFSYFLLSSTKAEKINSCLNKNLGEYGFNSTISKDKTKIFVDNQTIS
jgi:hypothetical protein